VPRVLKPKGEAYGRFENPRGELAYYVIGDGGKEAHRIRARGPSFCNLSVLEKIAPGHLFADLVAIVGSLDIVLGDVDR
jgi:NADH:ubiquinone oxidoreductase subunit D